MTLENHLTLPPGFTHPHTGKKKKCTALNPSLTAAAHVVYILTCPCGLVYVGQTKRALKSSYTNMRLQYVQNNHSFVASLKFWGTEAILEVVIFHPICQTCQMLVPVLFLLHSTSTSPSLF